MLVSMRDKVAIAVVKLREGAQLPERKHDTDAGYDIRFCPGMWLAQHFAPDPVLGEWTGYLNKVSGKPVLDIRPGHYVRVPTGIAVDIPDTHFLRLTCRSSTQNYVVEGVIDSGYHGEIMVGVLNTTNQMLSIWEGDRIAQFIIHERIEALWGEVGDFAKRTERGNGGFGSTGRS